jgi:DNA-binding CsgD family transcriptional regulator
MNGRTDLRHYRQDSSRQLPLASDIISGCFWFDPTYSAAPKKNDRAPRADLTERLFAIETAPTIEAIFAGFLAAIASDRFPFVSMTEFRGDNTPLAASYPLEWGREYLESRYFQSDPVIELSTNRASWFDWEEARRTAQRHGRSSKAMRIMAAAADHGLIDGICVPAFAPNGARIMMIMAGGKSAHRMEKRDLFALLALSRAALAQAHNVRHKMPVLADSRPQLTERELECLKWIGEGKTSQEIAAIIGISVHTVEFHLRNAMAKFNTGSRTHAYAAAIATGQIAPPAVSSSSRTAGR